MGMYVVFMGLVSVVIVIIRSRNGVSGFFGVKAVAFWGRGYVIYHFNVNK
jgi:hypothetical protein